MEFVPEKMRTRFRELGEQRADILGKSAPLREKRDEIVAKAREQELSLNKEILDIENGLFDIDTERAMISRALAGKTQEADEVADEAE